MILREEVFGMLGRVSVLFATLEAELGDLLCALAHPEEPLLAATLLERVSFGRTLQLLEEVAHFKGTAIEARIGRLLAVAKPLQKKRNRFVHGRWDLSARFLDQGKVAVADGTVEFSMRGNLRAWQKGKKHVVPYSELQEYQTEVMRALKLTKELLQTIENHA